MLAFYSQSTCALTLAAGARSATCMLNASGSRDPRGGIALRAAGGAEPTPDCCCCCCCGGTVGGAGSAGWGDGCRRWREGRAGCCAGGEASGACCDAVEAEAVRLGVTLGVPAAAAGSGLGLRKQ
jgi:hypothetical protein